MLLIQDRPALPISYSNGLNSSFIDFHTTMYMWVESAKSSKCDP